MDRQPTFPLLNLLSHKVLCLALYYFSFTSMTLKMNGLINGSWSLILTPVSKPQNSYFPVINPGQTTHLSFSNVKEQKHLGGLILDSKIIFWQTC